VSVPSGSRPNRAFDDEAYARDLVERYVGQLRDAVLAWDGPGKDQRDDR